MSNPERVTLLEPVKIIATVTNNGRSEGEDTDIYFELIKKDGAVIGNVNPEKISDGKYQIETILDVEGNYQIVSHVMPVYEINVSP